MEWIPLAVALVGSTGVVGGITAAVQLSRRARLTRSINAAGKLADQAAPDSETRLVLQQAIEMDILRLAAGSIIKIRPRDFILWVGLATSIVVGLLIAFAGRVLGLLPEEAPWAEIAPIMQDPNAKSFAGTLMVFVFVSSIGAGLGLNTGVYREREEFVASAILRQNPPVITGRLRGLARAWNTAHPRSLNRQRGVVNRAGSLEESAGPDTPG